MNEVLEMVYIFCCGFLGVSVAVFLKMQDITDANENLNFWQVASLFFKKAWASYGASLTVVLVYAVTHEEWIELFVPEKEAHGIVTKIIGMVMIMGFLVGFAMQYGYYKVALKKVDKALKAWGGDSEDRAKDTENKSDV